MKIRIEIDTTESAPNIVDLVTNMLPRLVQDHLHGSRDGNVPTVFSGENLHLLEEGSEGSRYRFEMTEVTKASTRYVLNTGEAHSATFSLETTES